MSGNKPIRKKSILFFIFSLSAIFIFLRLIVFDVYLVPSPSMLPTIKVGNYLIVKRALFGQRDVRRGDIEVFYRPAWQFADDTSKLEFVKRCVGVPGDTVSFNKPSKVLLTSGGRLDKQPGYYSRTFPSDSTFKWTPYRFGPLWIPKKDVSIALDSRNIKIYHSIIERETKNVKMIGDGLFLNAKKILNYRFKQNYYFMVGDNFYDSEDSRYWGFVPAENLIGKVVLIL